MQPRILLPIKNHAQGKFAVKTILSNLDFNAAEIRLFHCIEDKLARATFFSSLEAIRLADEQFDKIQESNHLLEQLGKELVEEFPNTRISVKTELVHTVHEGIIKEADIMQATKIVIVTEPERKLRWFIPETSTRIMCDSKIPVHVIKPQRESSKPSPRVA